MARDPYQHEFVSGTPSSLLPGKIVCVAKNYADHVKEMDSVVPQEPLFFMKPSTAFWSIWEPIAIPKHGNLLHHEVELAMLIGKKLKSASETDVCAAISGFAIAIDLTLRDVQAELKAMGRPWEASKSFDRSCPISPFVSPANLPNPKHTVLKLSVNGAVRQEASTSLMIRDPFVMTSAISKMFTLLPGDVVLTGTPAGVGPLQSGDSVVVELDGRYEYETRVE